jgi:hypothetical protein
LLFSNTLRYRTSNPLLVNINRLNDRLSGGRLHAFWFVMLVSVASAVSTYSLPPENRAIFQTILLCSGSYLARPWLVRSVVLAVFSGVGMRMTTFVANSFEL